MLNEFNRQCDLIYDFVQHCNINEIDLGLKNAIYTNDIDILLCWLTATLPIKTKLRYRKLVFIKTMELLLTEIIETLKRLD